MIKSTYQSLLLAFIFLFWFISPSSAHNNTAHDSSSNLNGNHEGCFSKVYAFGESDTDTGNAHFLGGFVRNSTTRLSNGRLVLDFLCEALSLPPIPPYKEPSANFTNGVNFAIAGSTALSRDYFVKRNVSRLIWKGVPMSFQTQIDWFEKYLVKVGCKGNDKGLCKVDMDNSLFWIGEMGVSDYTSALGSPVSLPWLTEITVKNICKMLKALLANGAKYVVVQGLPSVGCLPLYMSSSSEHNRDHMGCAATANKAIMLHNKILETKLAKLRKMYPNSSILYADYWNAYLTVLMNPKKYYIDEAFKACCGSGGGKLNFN
ncbi:Carboxylesterase [Handroanthus impetiginosus]|uniref:Carboxylesterase n=1 Tax=Handroanthus impetiginosus TaxID=429701 RepID=A0A2G9GW73_9LAMI|nr:Carboxylesterase [Handroanthus impetiginosus]